MGVLPHNLDDKDLSGLLGTDSVFICYIHLLTQLGSHYSPASILSRQALAGETAERYLYPAARDPQFDARDCPVSRR